MRPRDGLVMPSPMFWILFHFPLSFLVSPNKWARYPALTSPPFPGALQLGKTGVHPCVGFGVFAMEDIPPGECIMLYAGEVITPKKVASREEQCRKDGTGIERGRNGSPTEGKTYVYGLQKTSIPEVESLQGSLYIHVVVMAWCTACSFT